MNRFGAALMIFSSVLGLIVYAADVGVGLHYWGWLHQVPLGDKLGHLVLMFTFCLLANLALSARGVLGSRRLLLGTLIVSILIIAEEISQRWIPGRSFDLLDLTADFVGIACGDLLSRFWAAGRERDRILPAIKPAILATANVDAQSGERRGS